MTELSPAAQAVLDAFRTSHTGQGCLAAAIRAAVGQMRYEDECGLLGFGGYIQAQDQILAIATELEAQ